MGQRIEVACEDCSTTWEYVNKRKQGGGGLPKRCPSCRDAHVARRTQAYVATHTLNAKRWRLANPEAMAAARAKWEKDNPERRREHRRAGKKKNPIANRSYVRARNARKRALTVLPVSSERLAQRLAFYGGRCWMCGSDENITIDHVKPLSKGGAHMLCNLRPACHDCNTRKGARWPFPTSPSSFPSPALAPTG